MGFGPYKKTVKILSQRNIMPGDYSVGKQNPKIISGVYPKYKNIMKLLQDMGSEYYWVEGTQFVVLISIM
jgi:hypothetical protein